MRTISGSLLAGRGAALSAAAAGAGAPPAGASPFMMAAKRFSSAIMALGSLLASPLFWTDSISVFRKSEAWNTRSNRASLTFPIREGSSRRMKKTSSTAWARVEMPVNSIMAEEPLMVCMVRKISLILSSLKLLDFSASRRISSSCSSREVLS